VSSVYFLIKNAFHMFRLLGWLFRDDDFLCCCWLAGGEEGESSPDRSFVYASDFSSAAELRNASITSLCSERHVLDVKCSSSVSELENCNLPTLNEARKGNEM
jgi:hypothetical protein